MATRYHNEIVRLEAYAVHFDCIDNLVKFEVYPVQDWKGVEQTGYSYINKHTDEWLAEFDKENALMQMKGTVVWRGMWDSRLYFTDKEYTGQDLGDLSQLFTDHISEWAQQYLSLNKPDRK